MPGSNWCSCVSLLSLRGSLKVRLLSSEGWYLKFSVMECTQTRAQFPDQKYVIFLTSDP